MSKYLKNVEFSINTFITFENYVYMADCHSGGLYLYTISDKKIEVLCNIAENSQENESLYIKIVRYKSELYFIPYNAESVCVYDIDTKQVRYIELPESICALRGKFYTATIVDNRLYLFGYRSNVLLILDLVTGKFISEKNINDKLMNHFGNSKEWLVQACIEYDKHMYAVSRKSNYIIDIDMGKELCLFHKIENVNSGFIGIKEWQNNLLFITDDGSKFIKYNIKTGTLMTISNESDSKEWAYAATIVHDNRFYIFPHMSRKAVFVDLNTDKLGELKELSAITEEGCWINEAMENGGLFWFNRMEGNGLLNYNPKTSKVEIVDTVIAEYPESLVKRGIITEQKYVSLDTFVEFITL